MKRFASLAILFALAIPSVLACGYGGFARNCTMAEHLDIHAVHTTQEHIFIGEVRSTDENGTWYTVARAFVGEFETDSVYIQREDWFRGKDSKVQKVKVGQEYLVFASENWAGGRLYECSRSSKFGSKAYEKDVAFFFDIESRADGLQSFRDAEGHLTAQGELIDGKPNGVWKYFTEGKQFAQKTFNLGVIEGESIDFSEEGVALNRTVTQDGQVVLTQRRNADGQLYSEDRNEGGVRTISNWYANGQLRSLAIYTNEQRDQIYRSYHENGKVMREYQYRSGQPVGSWTQFDESGKLISTTEHGNGDSKG